MARASVLFVGVAIGASLVACSEEPPPEPIRPVRSMLVANAAGFQGRWWPGRAKAALEVDLSFEVAGRMVERPVAVGDVVEAGQILARLDSRDFDNALARARAERDRAEAFYQRVARAVKTGAVSEQEFTDARARYDQAVATVEIRQKAVDDTRIVAPFDGTVSRTYMDNFTNVRVKQPVMRLLDVSRMEMIINIPEDRINFSEYVENIRVRCDALPNVEIPAEIREISNEASKATRTFPVTLSMDHGDVGLQPGMACEATAELNLPDAREGGVEVPASAIFSPDDAGPDVTYVWIVDEESGTVSRRQVLPRGMTLRGGTLVDGLEPGERIATAGVNRLREGQRVRVQ